MLQTGVDNNFGKWWIILCNAAADPTTPQGITPQVPSVSAAPPSQQANSPEQERAADGKPGV